MLPAQSHFHDFPSRRKIANWILVTGLVVGTFVFPSRASESRAAVFWAEPDFRYFSTTIPGFTNIFGGELVERDANSVAMSADAHGLALHQDGTVTFWGSGSVLSNGVPSSLRGVVAIAPLVSASVALRSDGSLVAWTTPEGPLEIIANGVKSIAYGYEHVVALKTDGTVTSWSKVAPSLKTPKGLRDVVSVVAAGHLAGALRSDGTVVQWSMPLDGGFLSFPPQPPPEGLSDVVRLYAGPGNFYAVRRDGSLVTWGLFTQSQYPPLDPGTVQDVVQVSEDLHYALFLRGDGGVTAWGWMDSAAGTTVRARVPDGLGSVVAVAAGTRSAMALRSDGTLVSWRASLKECPIPEIASVNVTSIQAAGLLRLSVGVPSQPEVVRPPQDVSVHSWQSAHFDVEAHGFGLQFQWYTNGTAVSGATGSTFHVDGSLVGLSQGVVAKVSVTVESPNGHRISPGPVSLNVLPTLQPGTVLEWGPGGGCLAGTVGGGGPPGGWNLVRLDRGTGTVLEAGSRVAMDQFLRCRKVGGRIRPERWPRPD
ncbi:MAG: hypothetical protein U1G08_18550 [Verrucomicrobiota bacterium]